MKDLFRQPRTTASPGFAHQARLGAILGAALLTVLSVVGHAADGSHGMSFELRGTVQRANPPLPDPSVYPVQLVLDDDQIDGVFGFGGSAARQFLWFNSFENPGPFQLEEIWVLFPAGSDVPMNGAVQLAVFRDPDNDPTNGADVLATYDVTIQANDGDTFSVYPLATPLAITAGGDVLIGVVNRFFETGVTPPPTRPAALDTPSSVNRSYVALWALDAPDPPDLASATSIAAIGAPAPVAFMIRGFGRQAQAVSIPAQSTWGLVLLGLVLAVAAFWRLRGR